MSYSSYYFKTYVWMHGYAHQTTDILLSPTTSFEMGTMSTQNDLRNSNRSRKSTFNSRQDNSFIVFFAPIWWTNGYVWSKISLLDKYFALRVGNSIRWLINTFREYKREILFYLLPSVGIGKPWGERRVFCNLGKYTNE